MPSHRLIDEAANFRLFGLAADVRRAASRRKGDR